MLGKTLPALRVLRPASASKVLWRCGSYRSWITKEASRTIISKYFSHNQVIKATGNINVEDKCI